MSDCGEWVRQRTPPNWLRRNCGLTGVFEAKKLRAFSDSWRKNSKAVPRKALLPDLVVRLTTPPLKRPNSAGGLLLSILNSWIASMFGKERHLPRLGLQHRDAVEQILVGARPSAVDARQRRRGRRRQRHARHQARQRDEAPAVERQVDDSAVVDDVAESRGLAAQQRRVSGDRDGFGQASELEPQVHSNRLASGEPDAFARQRPESAQFDAHLIDTGGEPGTT